MLRFFTAGESHGQALLAFISGLPAQLPIDLKFINHQLRRRQLGYGRGGRQKIEKDTADVFAGVRHGKTIGAPIALRIENRDWVNWEKMLPVEAAEEDPGVRKLVAPRPGHADLAGSAKPRHAWRRAPLQNCFCANSERRSRVTRSRWGMCVWKNQPLGRRFKR